MSETDCLSNIRTQLAKAFNYEELCRFCYDTPAFKPVYDRLTRDTSKAEVIDYLIKYADRNSELDTLIAWIKEHDPSEFENSKLYSAYPGSLPASVRATRHSEMTENLDAKILRILYGYSQTHPGNPEMNFNQLIRACEAKQVDVVQYLYRLQEVEWVDFKLTDKAETGLVWLTSFGFKVARDV